MAAEPTLPPVEPASVEEPEPPLPGPPDAAPIDPKPNLNKAISGGLPALRALRAPLPAYPREARRAGVSGVDTLLAVVIEGDGRVRSVSLVRTCGWAAMDRSAINTVKRRWRFEPWSPENPDATRSEQIRIHWKLD